VTILITEYGSDLMTCVILLFIACPRKISQYPNQSVLQLTNRHAFISPNKLPFYSPNKLPYLQNPIVEDRKIRRQALKHVLLDGELHRPTVDGLLLKYLDE
jgi:hypothetical protein